MFVLSVLICIVLRAFSAQAKVADDFDCKEFFYGNKEPGGMDQNAKKICQYTTRTMYYFASLYSIHHRIPLYSAYRFNPDCMRYSGRASAWNLEPQISKPQDPMTYMVSESQKYKKDYKGNQATSDDYSDTGFDMGHLYPNSFECGAGRMATNTLTNVAPMDPCFNRIYWKEWEEALRNFLFQKLQSDKDSVRKSYLATAFIVTGTVPAADHRIPQKEISAEPERVTVPSHIWTAVCYQHHSDNAKSFSFGYIGKNRPEGGISMMSIESLNDQLSKLSGSPSPVEIFEGNCFSDNNKLSKVQEAFQKLINLPGNEGVQMSPDAKNTLNALKRTASSDIASPSTKISNVVAQLSFTSLQAYSTVAEDLKVFAGSACLITQAKREESKDAVECLLVPEKKTAPDGSQCSSVTDSGGSCKCLTAGHLKPCCSSSCLYQDKLKGYGCLSGQTLIPCSPQYSLITARGEKCKDDHPCGTYGKDHFWCITVSGRLGDCSPPLFRSKAVNGKICRIDSACAKYGESQPWCYTNDGSKNKCCVSDDCFSAENGLTCRPNHPCGKYGKDHLWCFTDDKNTVAKCCTGCGK